jgi:hyperosmotically inducible periplasmic protein
MQRARTFLVVAALTVGLFAGSARADQDADVAARVRQALSAAHIPNAANLQIQSFNGEVDLAGVVFTERSKARVASIASVVPGVTSVHNDLEVQPRSDDDDDATTARVKAALTAANLADAGPIEVSTFNGEVDLSGVVYSNAARTQVIDIAGSTRGATSVSSSLEVRDRP